MPTIHWFEHEDLKSIRDSDFIRDCTDDDGDGKPDIPVLDQCRQDAEAYVKDRVSVRYDVTQWDVDANGDGISDNLPGSLKRIAKEIDMFYIAARRNNVHEDIQRMFDIAELKLERIANGTMLIAATESGARAISTNMAVADFGQNTENGEVVDTAFVGWHEMI